MVRNFGYFPQVRMSALANSEGSFRGCVIRMRGREVVIRMSGREVVKL